MRKEIKLSEPFGGKLKGSVELFTCTDPLLLNQTLLYKGENLIVSTAETVIVKMFMREYTDYMPYYIGVGDGGDLEQLSKKDAGTRVAPELTDTEIRSVVARLPILQVNFESDTSWTYVAIAKPHQANTMSLNELTLETFNNTLISHFVTIPDPGETRSKKFIKSSLEYLVVRWTLTFDLA